MRQTPLLTFEGKTRSPPKEGSAIWGYTWVGSVPSIKRLVRKNTLAYLSGASKIKKKSFIRFP